MMIKVIEVKVEDDVRDMLRYVKIVIIFCCMQKIDFFIFKIVIVIENEIYYNIFDGGI